MLITKCWVNRIDRKCIIEFEDGTLITYNITTNKKFRFRSFMQGRMRFLQTNFTLPYLSSKIWKQIKKGCQVL